MAIKPTPARRNEQARGLGQMGKTSTHVACALSGRTGSQLSGRYKPKTVQKDFKRFHAA